MSKTTYSDQLKDPRWQKKRSAIISRDNGMCVSCGSNDYKTLQVHHLKYQANRKAWEYENEFFVTLCEECHNMVTNDIDESIYFIRRISSTAKRSMLVKNILKDISSASGEELERFYDQLKWNDKL